MKNSNWVYGALIGWILAVALNAMPFSSASIYKAAIKECEKSLPRDKHCIVIGVEAK